MLKQCVCGFMYRVWLQSSTCVVCRSTMQPIYLLILSLVPCLCQRPFYAGKSPIGYPKIQTPGMSFPELGTIMANFPPELKGDTNYAQRLESLPVDQQPFFYINKEQYKDLRENPRTYPLRQNGFIDQP